MSTTHAPAPHRPWQLPALAGWLVLTFIAAAVGAWASANAQSFYQQLQRPDWAPPAWLFGPAWSALYLLMAIAAWRVQRAGPAAYVRPALTLYVVQLALNALWSWLFFGWHRGAWAFGEILLLWATIAATLVAFWRRDRWAGVLLVPYIAWVSFAACLCYAIWERNPELL